MREIDFIAVAAGAVAIAVMVFAWLRSLGDNTDIGCRHDVTSDWRWTQDGWVKVCLSCREWIYGGYGDFPPG